MSSFVSRYVVEDKYVAGRKFGAVSARKINEFNQLLGARLDPGGEGETGFNEKTLALRLSFTPVATFAILIILLFSRREARNRRLVNSPGWIRRFGMHSRFV